jgi:hypothetical protein
VTPTTPGAGPLLFTVPAGVHTTREQGEVLRANLEKEVANEQPTRLEISFDQVEALTISYTDAFLGRYLTELTATQRDPLLVIVTGLTEDTASELRAVFEQRKLVVAAVVDGHPTLLGGDEVLRATFVAAARLGRFSPSEIAEVMSTTPQNANNRLKRLVSMGALRRYRSDPASGGREFAYEVHELVSPADV